MTLYGEKWTDRDVEAYAHALYDLWEAIRPCGHHKSYDPLTITHNEGKHVANSYVFDLWDGGRHHEWNGDLETLKAAMVRETVANIQAYEAGEHSESAKLDPLRAQVRRRDNHIMLQDLTALAAAELLIACDAADAVEELPGELDGSHLDAVRHALIDMYPKCEACDGKGGDETANTLCAACRGTCVELPPKSRVDAATAYVAGVKAEALPSREAIARAIYDHPHNRERHPWPWDELHDVPGFAVRKSLLSQADAVRALAASAEQGETPELRGP